MRAPSLISLRRRGIAARRAWALLLLAWSALLVQPCLAALQPAPTAMTHCHHAAPAADMPCHVMSAVDCAADGAANVDIPDPPASPPAAAALIAAGADRLAATAARAPPRGGTGPPAHIRFCSLSN